MQWAGDAVRTPHVPFPRRPSHLRAERCASLYPQCPPSALCSRGRGHPPGHASPSTNNRISWPGIPRCSQVLLPYNPWDSGTRPEARGDAAALAALLEAVGADGFNGDTMQYVPRAFAARGMAAEAEGGGYATMALVCGGTAFHRRCAAA